MPRGVFSIVRLSTQILSTPSFEVMGTQASYASGATCKFQDLLRARFPISPRDQVNLFSKHNKRPLLQFFLPPARPQQWSLGQLPRGGAPSQLLNKSRVMLGATSQSSSCNTHQIRGLLQRRPSLANFRRFSSRCLRTEWESSQLYGVY